jgi:hypothetical protein
MSSPTTQTIVQLAAQHSLNKQNCNEFFIDSDKCINTTIDEFTDIPCELEEAVGRAIPSAKYNGSDKLRNHKGHITDFGSDKSIVSLNSDNQSSRNLAEEDSEAFAEPLCAFRRHMPEYVNHSGLVQEDDESSDIYNLSESSVSESIESFLSSARSFSNM